MFNRILKNWKTTVAGGVFGFGTYLIQQAESGFTWETFVSAGLPLILGMFSKD